ncbi:MAG: MspA family porin [Gordonia sp. (in: high G+C Gram-positive bacteria)]
MSKFSKLGLRRAAGAVAVTAVAAIGAATMGAGHAEAVKLANGYKVVTGVDGEWVKSWRYNESARAIPTTANNPTQRAAVLNGTYTVKASPGVTGTVYFDYLVGCQVDVSDLTLGATGGVSLSGVSASGSLSIPLAPGEVTLYDDNTDGEIKDGKPYTIQVTGLQLSATGCAGYASARSVLRVQAAKGYSTDGGKISGTGSYVQSTLYGQPFSLN